jgi:hypothetical protein
VNYPASGSVGAMSSSRSRSGMRTRTRTNTPPVVVGISRKEAAPLSKNKRAAACIVCCKAANARFFKAFILIIFYLLVFWRVMMRAHSARSWAREAHSVLRSGMLKSASQLYGGMLAQKHTAKTSRKSPSSTRTALPWRTPFTVGGGTEGPRRPNFLV